MSPHRKQAIKQASAISMKSFSQWISVVIISFIALLVSLGAPFLFGHKIEVGEIAERDYVSNYSAFIVDLVKTQQAQDTLRESMLPVFRKDPALERSIIANIDERLNNAAKAQNAGTPSADSKLLQLIKLAGSSNYPLWRTQAAGSVHRLLSTTNLLPGETKQEWQRRLFEYLPDSWPLELRNQTAAFLAASFQPNITVDMEATHQAIKEKMAHTAPITRQVASGTVMVPKGEVLTSEDVSTLNQMGITHTQDLHGLLAIAIALVAAFFFFGIFLYNFEPQFLSSPSAIALMATVSVVTCGIASTVGKDFAPFVPLPATVLILFVIFGRRVALVLALLIVVFLRVSDLVDAAHLVALAAASGIALGSNITKRKELMLAGILIGVIQSVSYFFAVIFCGMAGSAIGMGRELVENLLGGLSSSIIAIGSLPYLEGIFGILTPFRVAELSEPDQPLLRKLEENAPGTYQHSLAVANLAESGAKAIGADVNLVRAGAMYHDIGKMVTPRFFIENQLGGKNPHDEISPEESRAKVLGHVTNGLVLAAKYSLPEKIQAFIPEHQGTTIMAYFYHKACMRDGVQNVKETDYRYPGPKPQTRETAIVMLADVSEAVTHSMHDPSQEEVETAIGNVFKARWDDGQFNESELTTEELEKVKKAFVRVWRTLHHERLKYPSTTTGRMPVPPQYPGPDAPPSADPTKTATVLPAADILSPPPNNSGGVA